MPRQIWKNKPDSKLALPQLATLGAVVSKEMHGNHLVAQHESGTAIIKDAKVNPNAPLSSLHWGIQAYKDTSGNKRLFVSTADGTYPVGWENIKYDDEAVNTIFYDVGRTSTSNNIAGLIYEEDGKLKVYIGEGYENLSKSTGGAYTATTGTGVIFEIEKTIDVAIGACFAQFLSSTDIVIGSTYTVDYEILEGFENFKEVVMHGSVFGTSQSLTTQKGTMSSTARATGGTGINVYFPENLPTGSKLKIKIQITKTSTPKPFTEGIVPNGALKVECDWTSENKSFVSRGLKKNNNPEAGGMTFVRSNGPTGTSSGERVFVYTSNIINDYFDFVDSKICSGFFNPNFSNDISKIDSGISNGFLNFTRGLYSTHNSQVFNQILIYNNPNLTQAQMEAELAKDIHLPTYHHQPNSVINMYGISGMSAMYLFQPALTSAEVDAELGKDIYLPKTQWDIPDYLGNS